VRRTSPRAWAASAFETRGANEKYTKHVWAARAITHITIPANRSSRNSVSSGEQVDEEEEEEEAEVEAEEA